jgi:hypothetical protein
VFSDIGIFLGDGAGRRLAATRIVSDSGSRVNGRSDCCGLPRSGVESSRSFLIAYLLVPLHYWSYELYRRGETLMNYRILVGCIVLAGLSNAIAVAQNSVGEVLDAGGKKLTKDEFVAAIVGSNITGPTQVGGRVQVNYKADGTFSGNVTSPQGKNGGRYGTWRLSSTLLHFFEI